MRPRPLAAALLVLGLLATGCAAGAASDGANRSITRAGAPSAAVRALRADLDRIFGAPIMSRGVWAVDVRRAGERDPLYQLNAGKLMMPASNMKVVTLATAAEVLGWDYRFTTTLETAGAVENGVLRGDLVIRGTGDPTINWRDGRAEAVLREWASALRAAGIRRIDGRIVGDDQAFDEEWLGPGWSWDYLQYGYAAPVGALMFDESAARLVVDPGAAVGDPAVVTFPAGTGLSLLNRAVTLAPGSAEIIEYRRHLASGVLELTGGVPLVTGAQVRRVARHVAVVNPTVFFVTSVRQALIDLGIDVTGEAVDMDDIAHEWTRASAAPADGPADPPPQARRLVATTHSPSLHEIGTVMMKVSQNLYAEALVKAMGAARGGLGTTAGGRARMVETLTAWEIPADSYVIADGSGLSRYNYLTASMLIAVLQQMHGDSRHRERFADTLPVAGKDGTIGSRMRRSRAEGNALAKTGSIANVRALSGYVATVDGETLVFSIVANDFPIPAATVTWIADLAVETLANVRIGRE